MFTYRKTACATALSSAKPINQPWWDDSHHAMWRLSGWRDLAQVVDRARRVGRECVAGRAALLSALEQSGLSALMDPPDGSASRACLAAFELARTDSGAAANLLSSWVPQMPIREFGTPEQQTRYLDAARFPHGALCVTEVLPGAGADAANLNGSVRIGSWTEDGGPVLHVAKRGRFISHMEFADFVVIAVGTADSRIPRGCLIIVEPGDAGVFDRGVPVGRFGHPLSSVTCPVFDVQVPASRILGGYCIDGDRIVPRIGIRQALVPAFRFGRVAAALMTASKVLGFVETALHRGYDDVEQLAMVWAGGEAASSLAFAAARACDDDAILVPSAKLFSSAHAAMRIPAGNPELLMDAQVEAVFLGPEAVLRREIAAHLADSKFLARFLVWAGEVAHSGATTLAEAMRVWHWTVEFMNRTTDSGGERLLTDVRQGATFPMADALCRLLAARALVQDIQQLPAPRRRLFSALSALESASAAGAVLQSCETAVFGFGVPAAADRERFWALRTQVFRSLTDLKR